MASTIRDWARSQGMEVADRGMIPEHILTAYTMAHGIGDEARAHQVLVERASAPASTFEPTERTVMRSLPAWLALRDELAALINVPGEGERIAERILLAGWLRPSESTQ